MYTKQVFITQIITEDSPFATTFRAWGRDEENKKICINIIDYEPFLYIYPANNVEIVLKSFLKEKHRIPSKIELVNRSRLYYADLDTDLKKKEYTFAKCSFKTNKDFRYINTCMRRKNYQVFEHSTPLNQFIYHKNLKPVGWHEFICTKINDTLTFADEEYECSYNMVKLITMPFNPKFSIISFDIEVYSSVSNRFPIATIPEDSIIQISAISDDFAYLLYIGPELDETKFEKNCQLIKCNTETELLTKFVDLINSLKPDFLIGYNTLIFDIKYIIDRAKLLRCFTKLQKLGLHKYVDSEERKIMWSSSAYRNQEFTFLDPLEGIIFIDLLPIIRRDKKLESYTLKNVATQFLDNITKDPITPLDIFNSWKEQKASLLTKVGKYCIQDSNVVLQLFKKFDTLNDLIQFSAITYVGILDLIVRGQQLKVYNKLAHYCFVNNIVIDEDTIYNNIRNYVGARVFDPTPGIYENAVSFDFNSLYPTTILVGNICFSTCVPLNKIYNIPEKFLNIYEWEDHIGCQHDEKLILKEKINKRLEINKHDVEALDIKAQLKAYKPATVICEKRKFVFINHIKGVVPSMVEDLLSARKQAKTEMKTHPPDSFQYAVLNSRQNALKLCANSIYGFFGTPNGYLPFLPAAMTITYLGRNFVLKAAQTVTEKFEGNLIYGDSVTGDTPILLKKDDRIYIRTIKTIFDENRAVEYPGFKFFDQTFRSEKEYSTSEYKIWSNVGWTNIKKVIRHKTDKKIYNVLTHNGFVKVTEDHSLLTENGQIIKSSKCSLNTKLLSIYPNDFSYSEQTISTERAYIYGFFYGDGSCGKYANSKYVWALNNADLNILNHLLSLLEKEYPTHTPVIYDTIKSSGVYKLTVNNPKELVEEYRDKFYDVDKHKKVPNEIINGSLDISQSFFNGYFAADGCRKDKEKIGCTRFDNKGQIGSAGLYYLMKKLGYNVSLNTRDDKEDIFRLTVTKKLQRKIGNAIKKIKVNEHDDYVYDIETECGKFGAGIGDIIVKNTDSVYANFPQKFSGKLTGEQIKEYQMWAKYVSKEVSSNFPRPLNLEFEDAIYLKLIMFTKKRYIYQAAKEDGSPKKDLGKKGVLLVRRDNCKFVKKIYAELVYKIFAQEDLSDCIIYITHKICELVGMNVSLEDLTISKAVGSTDGEVCINTKNSAKKQLGDYSIPSLPTDEVERKKALAKKGAQNEDEFYKLSLPAHVQLAIKMRNRGMIVENGSRLSYLVLNPQRWDDKLCNKIEDVDFYKNNKWFLQLDHLYYISAMINSFDQLFGIVYNKKNYIDELFKTCVKKHKLNFQLKSLSTGTKVV